MRNIFFKSLIVGLCDTQIGGFSPIFTKKLTNKIGEKIGRFFVFCRRPIFLVGGEIVWWDTSLKAGSHRNDCERLQVRQVAIL